MTNSTLLLLLLLLLDVIQLGPFVTLVLDSSRRRKRDRDR